MIIFRNVCSEFQGAITALNLRSEPLSFDEVHSQLVTQEILLKSHQPPALANVACMPPPSFAPLLVTPQFGYQPRPPFFAPTIRPWQ